MLRRLRLGLPVSGRILSAQPRAAASMSKAAQALAAQALQQSIQSRMLATRSARYTLPVRGRLSASGHPPLSKLTSLQAAFLLQHLHGLPMKLGAFRALTRSFHLASIQVAMPL